MRFDTFVQAVSLAKKRDLHVCLGGGEPTVHPMFVEFVNIALRFLKPGTIGVVTNGKIAGRATFLAGLAKRGYLTAMLSMDKFHEPISNEVVQAFHNLGAIQNVTLARRNPRHIVGREMQRRHILQRPKKDPCVVEGMFVKPDGRMMQCGCPDAPMMGRIGEPCPPAIIRCCHRSKRFRELALQRRSAA